MTASNDLRAVVRQAVIDLDAEHYPLRPYECVTCYPSDGVWPCVSRIIADDLRAALDGDER